MAGSSAVLEDSSLLSRLDRGLLKLETVFALVSGIAVFMLMVLAVWSVGAGYVDWIEAAMPFIAIMGIAYTQRMGGHVRMDIVIGQLKGRALWAAELLSVVLILLLMLALTWGAWAHFDRSFDMTKPLWSRDSSIDIGLPIWPSKLVVPLAFGVICLRLVLQIWGYGRALVLGLERPVAVPLVQSAAEQAMAEAEHLDGRD
jgi:TRAP-type mannitol/chloroaromatic compound transport system permease small subunit